LVTRPANPRRFSDTYSAHRVSETGSEGKFLELANWYGVHLRTRVLALDWSRTECRSCGYEGGGKGAGRAFATSLDQVASDCPKCGLKALAPAAFLPDFVASEPRKIVLEIWGEKSSAKDAKKLEFYRREGFALVSIPNGVAKDAEAARPIFQLLALVCGTDHPERLFQPD
jgi:hypothetical protein